ncbi:MAG: phosphoesterase [Caballeronia mineralivorans]|nr:phosphoesterase [Caballeronia mineralivorans]
MNTRSGNCCTTSAIGIVPFGYADHASLAKFIERNWGLPPITERSRDNLPNPVQRNNNLYVPVNAPALGDLFDMFNFDSDHGHGGDNQQSSNANADEPSGAKGAMPF